MGATHPKPSAPPCPLSRGWSRAAHAHIWRPGPLLGRQRAEAAPAGAGLVRRPSARPVASGPSPGHLDPAHWLQTHRLGRRWAAGPPSPALHRQGLQGLADREGGPFEVVQTSKSTRGLPPRSSVIPACGPPVRPPNSFPACAPPAPALGRGVRGWRLGSLSLVWGLRASQPPALFGAAGRPGSHAPPPTCAAPVRPHPPASIRPHRPARPTSGPAAAPRDTPAPRRHAAGPGPPPRTLFQVGKEAGWGTRRGQGGSAGPSRFLSI